MYNIKMDENQPNQPEPISKTFTMAEDSGIKLRPDVPKRSGKSLMLIIILVTALVGTGFFLNERFKPFSGSPQLTPSVVPTPVPSPTPARPILDRSQWSFEVLNGSGVTGAAKKVADKMQALGYPVVKTGNADNSNYQQTQILAKAEFLEKVDLVVADLKDTIKIASLAGELKDSTASARIIIGKDSI